MSQPSRASTRARRARRWIRLSLVSLPTLALLALPVYNRVEPRVLGLSMFYWFQIAWIVLAAALTAAALAMDRAPDQEARQPSASGEG
jgi:Protein of unknown function (DUF3311)